MGQLEERFFSKSKETVVKIGDPYADELCETLSAGIIKGETLEGGESGGYTFDMDRIYDRNIK